MKITIQTPNFKAQEKLTDFVTANVTKLAGLSDRLLEAQVVLKINKSDTKNNKLCELKIIVPGNDLFAEKQSSTFKDAVAKCVDAIEHQINRWKDSTASDKHVPQIETASEQL